MDNKSTASVNKIVQIDEAQIHNHLDRVVLNMEALKQHEVEQQSAA